MTPDEALSHVWILDGLPPKILFHHQRLHGIPNANLPPASRKKLQELLAIPGPSAAGAAVSSPGAGAPQNYFGSTNESQQFTRAPHNIVLEVNG